MGQSSCVSTERASDGGFRATPQWRHDVDQGLRGDGKTGRRRRAAVAPSAAEERFQLLATRPTGTMDDKRDEAGPAG